jgi:hypothetical protein
MNTSLAYANNLIRGLEDGSIARDAARAFDEASRLAQDPAARARAEAAARAKEKHAASFEAFKRRMHARLAAKRAKAAAQRAQTAGPGWRICRGPTPHADLERLFKETLDLAFTATPWPPDIRVCWGELAPPNARKRTLAAYIPEAQRIVVDRRHVKDQSLQGFLETVAHEIVHVLYREHPHQSHGPDFQRTLARALQVLNDLAAPSAALAVSPTAGPPPPHVGDARPVSAATLQPPTGARWTAGGFVRDATLNPSLEYRG